MHMTKEEKAVFILTDNYSNWILAEGDMYMIRDHIEALFAEYIGFFISLQMHVNTDNNTFSVSLHTDSYKDCTVEQINYINDLGINKDDTQTTIVLFGHLAITVSFSHYID